MTRFTCLASMLALVAGCPGSSTSDAGLDAPIDVAPGVDAPSADAPGSDAPGDAPVLDAPGDDAGADAMADAPVPVGPGDCASDADCGPGGTCIELVPGGWRVCRTPVMDATACEPGRPDECCDTSECAPGRRCVLGPVRRRCAGPIMLDHNVCAADECATATDCTRDGAGRVCAPSGTFGPVNLCVDGTCTVDADCTAAADGHCVVFIEPCCHQPAGLYCTYGAIGRGVACHESADCRTDAYCGLDPGGVAACLTDRGPFCPL